MSTRRPVLRKQSTLVTDAESATRQRRHEWIERSLFVSFGSRKPSFLLHSVTALKSVASVEHIAHAVCKTFVDQNRACERIKAGVLLLAHWVICLVIIQS